MKIIGVERGLVSFTLVIIVFILTIYASLLQFKKPDLVVDEESSSFSVERAINHLEFIGEYPHPVSSTAHDNVKNYIMEEFRKIGLSPSIQKSFVLNSNWGSAAPVENIVAKLEGTNNTSSVIVSAHYDSAEGSYGVADNGAAVAALLETARVLVNEGGLKNDIIFLLTDGEEKGLLGAKAFVEEHPFSENVGIVLNFEARGNSGPSFLFETSSGNEYFVDKFVEGLPRPLANSLLASLYKIMPNDTDFTIFRERGMSGLNFAFGEGLNFYHTSRDTLEFFDKRSLYHQSEYMINLIRLLGNENLDRNKQIADSVYFNTIGYNIVSYQVNKVNLLTISAILLFFLTLFYGIKKKNINLVGFLKGFITFLVYLLSTYGLTMLIWIVVKKSVSNYLWMLTYDIFISKFYFVGIMLIALAFFLFIYSKIYKKIGMYNLTFGALFVWLIATIITSINLPGANHIFLWPTICCLIGINIGLFTNSSSKNLYIYLITSLGLIVYIPIFYFSIVLLTIEYIGVISIFLGLLFGLLIPIVPYVNFKNNNVTPIILVSIGSFILLVASLLITPTETRPNISNLDYVLDINQNKAMWTSLNKPDAFTQQFLDTNVNNGDLSNVHTALAGDIGYYSMAPKHNIQASSVTLIDEKQHGNKKTINLSVYSPKETGKIIIKSRNDISIYTVKVNGLEYKLRNTLFVKEKPFRLEVTPEKETILSFTIGNEDKLELNFIDVLYNLPEIELENLKYKPRNIVTYGNNTLLIQSLEY